MLAETKVTRAAVDETSDRSTPAAAAAARRGRPLGRAGARRRQELAARLVARCAGGDPEALAELHDIFRGPLLRLARSIVRSTAEAEEVVQDVFLYVWQRARSYDRRRASVSTWMTQIARSRAIDRLRAAGARQRTRARMAGEVTANVEPRAEDRLHGGQVRRRLRRALRVLPEAQRQAVVLAYYGEMTQSEIAAHSRIPLGTVKTRTHLAMRKLRAELAAEAS